MKNIKRVVLALATMTMLASCGAKEITKAEAVKIAEGYDSANVIYKSGKLKTVKEVKFSDNFPEALKSQYQGDTKEEEFKTEAEVLSKRITATRVSRYGDDVKFKANGKALEISYSFNDTPLLDAKSEMDFVDKFDENGYAAESTVNDVTTFDGSSGASYVLTIRTVKTYTWVK